MTVARGVALFVGGFGALNLIAGWVSRGFDLNLWWIDTRRLPTPIADGILLVTCALLLAFSVRPVMGKVSRRSTRVGIGILTLVAVINSVVFFVLRSRGTIGGTIVPLSLVVAGVLVWLGWMTGRLTSMSSSGRVFRGVVVTGVGMTLACGFMLAQMFFFGQTSYTRKVDAIVVLGARTYANGRPSQVLRDRTRTACDLYNAGLAEWIVMSGGPGDGDVHETEAMRRMAIEAGIPSDRILCDRDGLDTEATARNTVAMFREREINRVLAVSHWYHLPRIKMAYRHAGQEVYTTPAIEGPELPAIHYYVAREIAAVWAYYFRPLMG